jgi:hypothetical protein
MYAQTYFSRRKKIIFTVGRDVENVTGLEKLGGKKTRKIRQHCR